MIAIIESGATKGDWRILDDEGRQIRRCLFPGTNVSSMRLEDVEDILSGAIRETGLSGARGVYLYTAGVVTPAIRERLSTFIGTLCKGAEVDIQDDLMGAARGVCGREKGIVAILGTGSNVCFYDGVSVKRKVYSGGFIIGDDGSSAVLGKLFLSDYIKGLVPEPIASDFEKAFDASYAAIVEGVYRSASPSGYLGSIAPFLLERYAHPYVKEMVECNFKAFAERSLLRYDTKTYPAGIVGGFGYACKDILRPILESCGIRISRFIKAPVDGLCEYHASLV